MSSLLIWLNFLLFSKPSLILSVSPDLRTNIYYPEKFFILKNLRVRGKMSESHFHKWKLLKLYVFVYAVTYRFFSVVMLGMYCTVDKVNRQRMMW
jgi:hypothetical protein